MRLTMSGGLLSALRLVMSAGRMLLSADSASSSAGLATARSRSASSCAVVCAITDFTALSSSINSRRVQNLG